MPVGPDEVPVGYGDGLPDRLPDEDEPTFQDVPAIPAVQAVQDASAGPAVEGSADAPPVDEELAIEVERLVTANPPSAARRGRRPRREPVAA
jgi:single-strand DNA-binding protein